MYKKYLKRIFDICFSFSLIIIFLPVIFIIAIIVFLKSTPSTRGPLIFSQKRVGFRNQFFTIYKLRTLYKRKIFIKDNSHKENLETIPMGQFMRRFKFDEIPQLINVLKGDMSIIGPRPFIPSISNKFKMHETKRYLLRPGLTGLAQISGNDYLSWEQKLDYDDKYIDNISFLFDMKIIFLTIIGIFYGEKETLRRRKNKF